MPMLFVGVSHLRDIFYRMGLTDRDIVALSGGHTLVILLLCDISFIITAFMARYTYLNFCGLIRGEHIQRDQGLMDLGQRTL